MHDPEKLPVLKNQSPNKNTPKYALHNNSELTHYVDLVDFPNPWIGDPVSEEKARHLVHGYYACVSYVDAQIGRLLAALQEEGLSDNTIVVLWSDHGWKLGEYRGWGKMTNYEIDARVPLIISAPGMKSGELPTAGKQTEQLAELLDLFPTLCDLTGIETPDFVDGKSLVPIMKDSEAGVHEAAVSQYYRKSDGSEYMGYAIRTMSHRLVEWREFSTGQVTARELYDHQKGHSETENIIDSAPKELIEEITERLLAHHPRKGLVMTPAVHSKPSPDRLRASISFLNEMEVEITVNTINQAGRRSKRRKLSPGKKIKINASTGSVFVIESADGKVHKIHSPSIPERTVSVR